MNRRGLLKIFGVSGMSYLAGCVDEDDESEESRETEYSVVEQQLDIDSTSLVYDVSVVENQTDQNPLQLVISLSNEGSEITYMYGDKRDAMFIASISENEKYGLYPRNANEDVKDYNEEYEVWVRESAFVQTTDYQISYIEPGESVEKSLELLHRPVDSVSSELPDTLTFTTTINVEADANGGFPSKEVDTLSFRIEK